MAQQVGNADTARIAVAKDFLKTPKGAREEIMPQFPGGDEKMRKYIYSKIIWPVGNKESGRVGVWFVVSKTGKVQDVEVSESLNKACDKEAIRVIKYMPDWIPGQLDGEKVDVRYHIYIHFSWPWS